MTETTPPETPTESLTANIDSSDNDDEDDIIDIEVTDIEPLEDERLITRKKHQKLPKSFHGPKHLALITTGMALLIAVSGIIGFEIVRFWQQGSTVFLPPPPNDLSRRCSSDLEELKEACAKACAPSSCCLIPPSSPGSCLPKDDDDEDIPEALDRVANCAIYGAYCPNMIMAQNPPSTTNKGTIPIPASGSISSVCTEESLSTPQGYSACKEVCLPGECCNLINHNSFNNNNNNEGQCEIANPTVCDAYYDCALLSPELITPSSRPLAISSQVSTKCSVSALTTKEGVDSCRKICKLAMCCFASSSPPSEKTTLPSCLNAENFDWCSQYSACQTLHHLFDDISGENGNNGGGGGVEKVNGFETHKEQVSAVNNACSVEHGLSCQNICQPAACCFDEERNCENEGFHNVICQHYAACSIVFGDPKDKQQEQQKDNGATSEEMLLHVAESVLKACDEDKLDTIMGRSNCQHLCDYRGCCFEPNPRYNCVEDYKEECVAYAGCENLVGITNAELIAGTNGDDPLGLMANKTDSGKSGDFLHVVDTETTTTVTTTTTTTTNKNTLIEENVIADKACSITSLSAEEGIANCFQLCAPYLCCFLDKTHPSSCYNDHPALCDSYKSCDSLITHKHINPSIIPHHNTGTSPDANEVQETCTASKIQHKEGLYKCHGICADHFCCFVDERMKSSCLAGGECVAYQACNILLIQKYHAPNHDFESVTAPTTAGTTPATTSTTPATTTTKEGEDLLPTKALPGMNLEQTIIAKVNELCNPNLINPSGTGQDIDKCTKICMTRKCCFTSSAGSCQRTDKEYCDAFQACSNINEDFLLEHTVDALCNPNSLSTKQGLTDCHSVCAPYLCCFSDDEDENCYADHSEQCDVHSACELLTKPSHLGGSHATSNPHGSTTNEVTQSQVEGTCGSIHIGSTEGVQACHSLCASHLCCFVAKGMKSNCVDSLGAAECEKFDACGILTVGNIDDFVDDEDEDEKEEEDEEELEDVIQELNDVCEDSSTGIRNSVKEKRCEEICNTRKCCFVVGAGQCRDTDEEWCNEFQKCDNLGGGIEDVVGSACEAETIGTLAGLHECHKVCQSYLCCFSDFDEENCQDDHPTECEMYSACSILVSPGYERPADPGVEVTKQMVDNACDACEGSAQCVKDCHAICAGHLCCFSPVGTKSNCQDTMPNSDCDNYAACSILIGSYYKTPPAATSGSSPSATTSATTTTTTSASKDPVVEKVKTICTVSNVRDGAKRSECSQLCNERKCCFEPGTGNCYTTDKEWCDAFAPCEVLGKHTKPSVLKENIDRICQIQKLNDSSGRLACGDACKDADCCFAKQEENCLVMRKKFCEVHDSCVNFFLP